MSYPDTRLRRLRRTSGLRHIIAETHLAAQHLVQPLFVAEDPQQAVEIASMPGVMRLSLQTLHSEVEAVLASGVRAVMLFGLPVRKDAHGTSVAGDNDVIPTAIRQLRERFPELIIQADVCLCEYTDHGHCGIIRDQVIDNDATLAILAQAAVSYGRAGADIVAPSAMMDGMVSAIRSALDEAALTEVAILSYTVKYASSFYGPFREAAACAPDFGDRKSHQMDPANSHEALAETALDVEEGADMVMVKPAGPYLDIIRRLADVVPQTPVAAYQVSGEYAMLKAASQNGWLDEQQVVLESLLGIRRAGARMILTYYARQAAEWMSQVHGRTS
jgi:porphobilinogen synthase